jgi:hypothetical protein
VLDVVDGAVLRDLIEPIPDLADTPRKVMAEHNLAGAMNLQNLQIGV